MLRPDAVPADDPARRAQVAALERDATRWTGNDTRVLELSAADAPGGRGSRRTRLATDTDTDTDDGADGDAESVVDDVLRDGIPLAGDVAALRRLRTPHRRAR